MLTVSLDGLSFVAFREHLFKLLPSKHTETSVWHATPCYSFHQCIIRDQRMVS